MNVQYTQYFDKKEMKMSNNIDKTRSVKNPNKSSNIPFIITIVVIILALIGFGTFLFTKKSESADPQNWTLDDSAKEVSAEYVANPSEGVYIKFSNTESPRHIIDLFTDPMCSYCNQLDDAAGKKIKQYVEDEDIEFRVHPITYASEKAGLRYSPRIWEAIMTLAEQGDGKAAWNMYLTSYANKPDSVNDPEITSENLANAAERAGASSESIEKIKGITDGQVAIDASEANVLAMESHPDVESVGTPLLILDGTGVVQNAIDLKSWTGYIEDTWSDEEMEQSRKDSEEYRKQTSEAENPQESDVNNEQ